MWTCVPEPKRAESACLGRPTHSQAENHGQCKLTACRYEKVDIFEAGYVENSRDFDVAVVTLREAIGLRTGWLGAKALPPEEVCSSAPSTLPSLLAVGYPVEPTHSNLQYSDTCNLQVRSWGPAAAVLLHMPGGGRALERPADGAVAVLTQVADSCKHVASAHKCDTKVGNSGSPLVQYVDGPVKDWHIRAIHFAAMQDAAYNLAIPIDDQMLSWLECYKQNRTDCAASTWLAPVWR